MTGVTYRALAGTPRQVVSPVVAVGVLTLAVLALRMIRVWTSPTFFGEEAVGFWPATYSRPLIEQLAMPWNGFRYPIVRAAFALAGAFPLQYAPVVTLAVEVIVIALVAAFIASDRMAEAIQDERVRFLAAIALACLPFAEEQVYGTVLNVHWFLAIYLVALALAKPPGTTRGRWLDRLSALVAATSSPAAIAVLPVYVWRRRKIDRGVLLAVASGAAFQVASLLTQPRTLSAGASPIDWFTNAVLRVGILPLGDRLGQLATAPAPAYVMAATTVLLAIAAARHVPPTTVIAFGIVAGGVALIEAANLTPGRQLDPTEGARAYVLAAWLLCVIAAAAALHRSRAGIALGVILVVGMAASWFTVPTSPWPVDCDACPPVAELPVGMANGSWIFPTHRTPVEQPAP